jgi:type IV pilus assembly protein PilZ
VSFPGDDKSRLLRLRIEESIGTLLSSLRPTQTL